MCSTASLLNEDSSRVIFCPPAPSSDGPWGQGATQAREVNGIRVGATAVGYGQGRTEKGRRNLLAYIYSGMGNGPRCEDSKNRARRNSSKEDMALYDA